MRHAALLPDVPGDAGRIGATERRCAHRGAGRYAQDAVRRRVGHHVEGLRNLRRAEEIRLLILELGDADLSVGVVGPDIVDRALDTQHLANRVGAVIVLPPAAFDVAPTDQHGELGAAAAEERLIFREIARRADEADLLCRQQRVVAGRLELREGECAARAILRGRGIARIHGLGIDAGVLARVVMHERARGPALCAALKVAERTVVVGVQGGLVRPEQPSRRIDRVVEESRDFGADQAFQEEPAVTAGR